MPANFCPLVKGECREHKCYWYIQVQGTHPQTGVQVSDWGCAIAWLPWLLIENAKESRQTGAAVESFRNEVVQDGQKNRDALTQLALAGGRPPVKLVGTN